MNRWTCALILAGWWSAVGQRRTEQADPARHS
jgi:hypothetical protein